MAPTHMHMQAVRSHCASAPIVRRHSRAPRSFRASEVLGLLEITPALTAGFGVHRQGRCWQLAYGGAWCSGIAHQHAISPPKSLNRGRGVWQRERASSRGRGV